MRIFVCFIMLMLFSFSAYSKAGIAVIVDDDMITTIDVEERLKMTLFMAGVPYSKEAAAKFRPQVLQDLINEKLYFKDAKLSNITVSNAEIDAALGSLEAQNNIKPGYLESFLESNNISIKSLSNKIMAQILWQKILGSKIRSKIVVSDGEIAEKMEYISSIGGAQELHISEIVLDIKDENETQKLANNIYNDIANNGQNFKELARKFSNSQSAPTGGQLGWIREDYLSKDLSAPIRSLQIGMVSKPIKSGDSYYILKLNDKRAVIDADADETEIGFKQVFLPIADSLDVKKTKERIDQAQAIADSINNCEDFNKFAADFGVEEKPVMSMAQIKTLPSDVKNIVEDLPVGKIAPISRTNKGLHAMMICERTQAVSSVTNKNNIEMQILKRKMELSAKKYLRNLRKTAYIDIKNS